MESSVRLLLYHLLLPCQALLYPHSRPQVCPCVVPSTVWRWKDRLVADTQSACRPQVGQNQKKLLTVARSSENYLKIENSTQWSRRSTIPLSLKPLSALKKVRARRRIKVN